MANILEASEDQLLPVEQPPEVQLHPEVQAGHPGETDEVREEAHRLPLPGPHRPQSDGIQVSPGAPADIEGTVELQEDLDSESEDEAERDERGRIILPSRPVSPTTPSLRPSTAFYYSVLDENGLEWLGRPVRPRKYRSKSLWPRDISTGTCRLC